MNAPKPDVEGAKKLLAEAGYPNGFALTLATPNDRYVNDAQISQAVAQMLTRVGLKVSLDAMTQSQFFARRNRREFGFWLAGWGSDTGEMSSPLKALIATPNKDNRHGCDQSGRLFQRRGRCDAAEGACDRRRRQARRPAGGGSRIAMDDFGAIPLHFEMTTWAFKKELDYTPRADQFTQGTMVKQGQ